MKIVAIVLFILMYICLIAMPKRRAITALITAAVFVLLGILPLRSLPAAIDWNVLLMILGTLLLVDYFIESKMPNLIADQILKIAPNVMWVTILMSLFSGIISAFIDNVATLLMVAPVGLAVCKKLKINPVPMIISIAVSSNLQGGRYDLDNAGFICRHGLYGFLLDARQTRHILCSGVRSIAYRSYHDDPIQKGSRKRFFR